MRNGGFLDNPVNDGALVAVVVDANLHEALAVGGVRDEITFLVYLLDGILALPSNFSSKT